MAGKSSDGSNKPRRSKKERVWTETELKNLALVEKKQYAVRLETTSFSKLNSSIKCLFDILLFVVSTEGRPSLAALLVLEKSFASCVIAAILKFSANVDWKI